MDRRDVLISDIAAEDALEPRPVFQRELDLDGDDFAVLFALDALTGNARV